MTFLTRMKCPLALGLCILVVLSIFSSPALAAADYSTLFVMPYLYPDNTLLSYQRERFDLSDTQTFVPVNYTDLNYVPLSDSSVTIDVNGTISMDRLSSGDRVYIIYQEDPPTGKVRYQLMTLSPSGYVEVPAWTVDEVLGVVPYEDMLLSASVSLPADAGYSTQYTEGASSVVNMLDSYVGYKMVFDSPVVNLSFSFQERAYNFISNENLSDQTPISLEAGTTIRLSFPVGVYLDSLSDALPMPTYNIFYYTGNIRSSFSISDLYARNVGTAENPSFEYVYFYNYELTAIEDSTFTHALVRHLTHGIDWVGHSVNVEIIDSDAAVVSKLQQLLDYYSQNPPEADDLKAQSDMQKALEDAAMEDARNSVSTSASQAAPGTVIIDGAGISIASSISSWASAVTSFVSAVPWLGVILAFFVFTTLIKFLISR